ncbi:MAG TPA: thiamine-phosphate kinase [Steroidobacteraceae bacterium]|jgi:thiamine-monophosphate kinase|nr:thiamine-phosphate kinase [Steroidobacteraceae bacterium]
MALTEFALIERYFSHCGAERRDVELGVGDDAALLRSAAGEDLVAAIDTLVAGAHFLPDAAPGSIGHRALAVNLSDLAAMGARPAWALLALTLPQPDEHWLAGFARGFDALARAHDVALVGGDTTRGPLCITVQVLGWVPGSSALRRSGARPGDALFISGTAGDAAAGLLLEQGRLACGDLAAAQELRQRFLFPTPRVALGERLRTHASACIDVSDGLLGDAAKLAAASGCGVEVEYEQLPVSPALVHAVGAERARQLALSGGDDYELCFAVPPARIAALQSALPPERWDYRRIGTLCESAAAVVRRDGIVMQFSHSGFDHFAA